MQEHHGLANFLQDAQQGFIKVRSSALFLNKGDVKNVIVREIARLFKKPIIQQIIQRLKNEQYAEEEDTLKKVKAALSINYNIIARALKDETQSPTVLFCLNMKKEDIGKNISLFDWQRIKLYCALQYFYKEKIKDNVAGIRLLALDNEAKGFAESVLQLNKPTFLNKKKESCISILELCSQISAIKKNKRVESNDVLNVCEYFIQQLASASNFRYLKIRKITYRYYQKRGQGKRVLELVINDGEEVLKFGEERAISLYRLLGAPTLTIDNVLTQVIDFEDLVGFKSESAKQKSRENDAFKKSIKAANTRLGKILYRYGFVAGVWDLFMYNGYEYFINPYFSEIISEEK
jgi:hypothetical protein